MNRRLLALYAVAVTLVALVFLAAALYFGYQYLSTRDAVQQFNDFATSVHQMGTPGI